MAEEERQITVCVYTCVCVWRRVCVWVRWWGTVEVIALDFFEMECHEICSINIQYNITVIQLFTLFVSNTVYMSFLNLTRIHTRCKKQNYTKYRYTQTFILLPQWHLCFLQFIPTYSSSSYEWLVWMRSTGTDGVSSLLFFTDAVRLSATLCSSASSSSLCFWCYLFE